MLEGMRNWRMRMAVDPRPLQAALQEPSTYPLFLRTPLRRRLFAVHLAASLFFFAVDVRGTLRLLTGKT